MQKYDVIIVGGGPTGVALGIELGLNNIHTLILEKHSAPLLSPRAQSLVIFYLIAGLIIRNQFMISFQQQIGR